MSRVRAWIVGGWVALLVLALQILISGVLTVPARADDFRLGLRAFNRAEYAQSVQLWRPLAEQGNPDAQASLGYLYYHGLGVRQDYAAAAEWFQRAADQDQPDAQMFLGTLFYNGVGVPRSFVQAYKWCDIAQTNGASQAGPCREAAQQRLSDVELAESTRLVTDWFGKRGRHK